MATRRDFLAKTGSGVLALSGLNYVSPLGQLAAEETSQGPLKVLTEHQANVYAAWCEVLATGAAEANVARFLDEHLNRSFHDTLLMLKYLSNAPLGDFYVAGIAGIEDESMARFSKSFLDLTETQKKSVVDAAATFSTTAWTNPVPPFFYFISRSDAVDVVYGTIKGFRKLKVPYRPHIRPPTPW